MTRWKIEQLRQKNRNNAAGLRERKNTIRTQQRLGAYTGMDQVHLIEAKRDATLHCMLTAHRRGRLHTSRIQQEYAPETLRCLFKERWKEQDGDGPTFLRGITLEDQAATVAHLVGQYTYEAAEPAVVTG